MDIKDRGLMKWHGFFMPEHSRELKKIHREDMKVKMPILDEYQLQEFVEKINYSMEYRMPIEFKLYNGGFEELITGHVHYVDQIKRQFNVKDTQEQVQYVPYDEIMNVKIID